MTIQLNQQELKQLKEEGFTERDIDNAIKDIEMEELQSSFQTTQDFYKNDARIGASHSSFLSKANEDIAKSQLELDDILERAEHTLRGDIVVFRNGQLIWERNKDLSLNCLNEFGVQLIMRLLSMYVNKNTILSDYTAEEINFKVLDFGKKLNNLMFMKYEEMGMNTEEKRKEYPSIVWAMIDIVHSAYARAKDGRERESYRKMISVQQSSQQNPMMNNMMGMQQQTKTRGILNPMRYILGKEVK